MTHATFCSALSIAENPQQDKKNLLCLWEADGKLQRVLSFQYVSLISRKLSSAVTVLCWFSAPFRIPHATTGPTDWLWPNSVLLTSPSCLCCSKVTDTRLLSISCECHENEFTDYWHVFPLSSTPRHDIHQWGKSKLCRQIGQFWETGKIKKLATLLSMITLLKDLVLRMRWTQMFSFPPIRAAHDC